MEKKSLIIGSVLTLASLAIVFLLGFMAGYSSTDVKPDVITMRDTMTIYKTVEIEKPVPKYITVIRHDTVRLKFFETKHDTVLAEVPIERKTYQEDSVFRAVVSGFKPSLDTLIVYPTITTITVTKPVEVRKPAPKLSFGITAGPSVLTTPQGNVHAGLGATIGLSYRF